MNINQGIDYEFLDEYHSFKSIDSNKNMSNIFEGYDDDIYQYIKDNTEGESNNVKMKQNLEKNNTKLDKNILTDEKINNKVIVEIKPFKSNISKKQKKIKFTIANDERNYNRNKEHSKFHYDNKMQKMKKYFINSLKDFLNRLHRKIMILNNKKNYRLFLKNIQYKYYSSTNSKINKKFLNLTIKEFFSQPTSEKNNKNYIYYDKNYNKRQIEEFCKIYKKFKEGRKLYNILQRQIRDMINSYIKGDYEGFNVEKDLNCIRINTKTDEDNDIEDYIKELRDTIINFETIIYSKKSKNRKSKKSK